MSRIGTRAPPDRPTLRWTRLIACALLCAAACTAGGSGPSSGDSREEPRGDDERQGDESSAGDAATAGDTAPGGDTMAGGDESSAGDAGPVGTFASPIRVEVFPFFDGRDTRNAPAAAFDHYGCSPEADESGDAFVYEVTIAEPGIIEARLDDVPADAVDVDVHLLSAPDPEACLIRDNIALSFEVDPGTLYLVADTWVNDAGTALAGPYALSITFTPLAPATAPLGTANNPIVIDTFPFIDRRDTATSPQAAWDAYGCAPGTDEGGPEVVYVLHLPQSGSLTATIIDGTGVDIDVHLLDAADPSACVARANVTWTEAVGAGSHYVVADTWVDGTGEAQAGPYTLEVDFVPDAPLGDRPGSATLPILVDTFPFVDSRDTRYAASDAFSSYACEPSIDESGGEMIYAVTLASPAVLRASIDDLPGDDVDVDVHLLSALDPMTCLARDNRNLAYLLDAGTAYVVVDTWVGSGAVHAGPYTLELDAAAPPDLSAFCMITYGDTRGETSDDPQLEHQVVMAAMAARCPAGVFVHTGDLVRWGGSGSDWLTFRDIEGALLDDPARSLYPARGNHDGSWSNVLTETAPFLAASPPESNYRAELAPGLVLLVLDSEGDVEAQATWLGERLAAPEDAGARFVVAFHRPLYPSIGGHGGFELGQTHWMPLFREHADRVLVVTGHNHALSREMVDGVTFITSGGAGAPLYSCSQLHAGTRYCRRTHGYYACNAELHCASFEIDPTTGSEVIGDVFTMGP